MTTDRKNGKDTHLAPESRDTASPGRDNPDNKGAAVALALQRSSANDREPGEISNADQALALALGPLTSRDQAALERWLGGNNASLAARLGPWLQDKGFSERAAAKAQKAFSLRADGCRSGGAILDVLCVAMVCWRMDSFQGGMDASECMREAARRFPEIDSALGRHYLRKRIEK